MKRYPDWRDRLHAYIESRHQAAFSWGENNGALFAAGAVLAMTGRWLYPDSLIQAAPEADKQAEVAERAALADLERQARVAGRELTEARTELSERKRRLQGARAFVLQLPTEELPLMSAAVREQEEVVESQETALGDLRAAIGQQTVAVGLAGQRVMEALLASVAAQGGIEVLVTARLGEPLPGILLAQEGDVVMAEVNTGGYCLGICNGAHGIFVAEEGLSKIRLLNCAKAWRVPVTGHEWLNRRAGHADWHRGQYLRDAHRTAGGTS